MADRQYDEREQELLSALETQGEQSLSEDILKKWNPERLMGLLRKRAGKGEPLDVTTRSRYERLFQRMGKRVDLSKVRIFTGEFAEEVTKAKGAEAVTIANTGMVLMRGLPDRSPITRAGEALYAHELTHVAQAQEGRLFRSATDGSSAGPEEQEARVVESAVKQGEGGSDEKSKEEKEKELQEIIRNRVLDMFSEQERSHLLRNGPMTYRP